MIAHTIDIKPEKYMSYDGGAHWVSFTVSYVFSALETRDSERTFYVLTLGISHTSCLESTMNYRSARISLVIQAM